MFKKEYCFSVYILASDSGMLYVGMTNNLVRRVKEHREQRNPDSFTAQYDCHRLVYHDETQYVLNEINEEKRIKNMNRKEKELLIRRVNPGWLDLAADWFNQETGKGFHARTMRALNDKKEALPYYETD